MAFNLIALPDDIKFKIIQILFPLLTNPLRFPPNYLTVREDMASVFKSMSEVKELASTCKALRLFFGTLLLRAVQLKFNNDRVLTKEDGSIDNLCKHTFFLSLNSTVYNSEDTKIARAVVPTQFTEEFLDAERAKPIDYSRVPMHPLEISISRVFARFSSTVTLDFSNFPITIPTLMALQFLPSLRTLSLSDPDTNFGYIPNVTQIHHVCTMPKVTHLNLHMTDWKDAIPISNVAKLFERSIAMLSFKGEEYNTGTDSYISRVLSSNVHQVTLPNLKQFSIDFMEFQVWNLRKLIQTSPYLQTLAVDCRGADGFMPLFYLIDLIRISGGECFDHSTMMSYEGDDDMFDQDPYDRDMHMWKARVSRFVCSFSMRETIQGAERILDTAEIYLAMYDDDNNDLTRDLKFAEVLQVFHESKSTFRELKSLTFATANEEEFTPVETSEELKEMTRVLCRDCLPSAKDVTIRWGTRLPFRCSLGQIHDVEPCEIWQF